MKIKTLLPLFIVHDQHFKEYFRIMRVSLFMLFVCIFQLMATNTEAQNAIMKLETNVISIGQLINQIEKQTDYLVVFRNREVDTERTIRVQEKSGKVISYLKNAFEGTDISYEFTNKYILLSKKNHSDAVNDNQQLNRKITGTVKDNNGEPVIGANVSVKGTTNGTITDVDGNFSLENISDNDIIVISYIGYTSQEIKAGKQTSLKIILKEDTQAIDEVVVVGFGTQKKVNLTGSIGTVKTDEVLKSRPVTNVQELLAGSVPGMVVSKGSGAAGSGASINIRGTSTIGNSSGVLVLIDGMPGNIYTLNPNDIESVSVLKDAASAAIYGSRAANGVVLVTTKTAKATERPTVEFSSNIGIQNPQFKLDFIGSEDFMRLYDQAMINDGKDAIYGEQGIQDLRAGKYVDNKWYKEIYKKNTIINNTHLALSGKERSIAYRFSISNDYQDGNLPNNNYNRLIFKPDMRFQILKNLEAHASLQYTQTNIKNPNGGTTGWQSQAARISPITPIRNSDGSYAAGGAMGGNPIAGVNESGYSKERHKEMMAIFDVTYSPLKDWNIKGNIATYSHNTTTKNRVSTYYLYDEEGNIAKTENRVSSLKETNTYNFRTQLQFTTDYSFKIASDHNFKVLAGYSQEYYKSDGFWASRDNMPFDNVDVLNTGSSNKQNGSADGDGNEYANDVAVQSWFGRLNYDYQGKYLFEASLRADGSSRFAKNHRWGVFPSFSAGWNLHRESFMIETNNWLSELKIRASWGVLGDAEKVGYYPTAQILSYDPKIYAFNDKLVGGAYNNIAVNQNITWEESKYTNIGLDFGLFDQRIKLSADYFINMRDNILYRPPVPSEFGLNAPYSNLLKMKNQGMDIMAGYQDGNGDFHWGIDVNLSYSKNKVLEMGDSERWIENNTVTYLNDRYQLPFGYEAIGLFQSEEEIANSPNQGNVLPGNIKYKDQNGDNIIDGEDRVVLNRKIPLNFGMNLSFGYKDFDFSLNMYGKLNTKKYLQGYEGWAFYLTDNARPMHLDAWSESNPDASYPRLTLTNTSNDYDSRYNSFWLRTADYLKIQNVQVGYTVPQSVLERVNIKYLRVYLSGQNLATITGYDGFDPEGGWYPLARTFSFGFNLQF
ncbi:SusC/RagA family TonB-linked outer membrane protein [Parabacteroides goldsteinii]|uniref:SusC/RagA family TonB-linked outer membrane protein n=2 Tax=Parabacteroides goldsteinii TaxID=328812 RepID=A0A6G1Z9A1_9BACT|nr:SusC/RagA family TonB-linked outer membrane protein [Parabacteroides goldsteinii]MRX95846.1 SusC/RagA family TonB-linked outer membrane protein [Parabacteroides goldsteinii]MRY01047.1 SusC/RagA family TonB-linked outer membrane protein [Parabacteroides goldsteinii]MRY10523.1 SusC/RagA family TonB-linked outer membrane protein [Parabacteroides goldsteinii]MRY19244.1 SusC/RagA family TonB-linked outer membrane protein [Parabacteroides goldsteinii]